MKVTIRCADRYEAQKLASITHAEKGVDVQLDEIINVINEECIISLHDQSAHSILLHDISNAIRLADFIQSVCEGIHKIVNTKIENDTITIEKL